MRKASSVAVAMLLLCPVVIAVRPVSAAPPAPSRFDDAVVTRPGAGGAPRTDGIINAVDQPSRRTHGASLVSLPERGPTAGLTPAPTSLWVAAGHRGQGVRVGVIDYFDASVLATQIAADELPPIPAANRRCFDAGTICPFGAPGTKHGNAVVEIIADEAPDVEFFLAEVSGLGDYTAAIDWFAANGVRIVNHSLIGVYDGPGDGTGPRAAIVDTAIAKGMAWFNAGGDAGVDSAYTSYQGGYWRTYWTDPNGNGWLNFKGVDETLGTYCGALLGLRWSDWGASRTDYQLWVGDFTRSSGYNAAAVLASDANQAAGAAPLEANDFRWLCNTDPALGPVYDKNKDGYVSLKVKRSSRSLAASSVGDVLELQVINGWFEYSTSPGSAGIAFADSRNLGAAAISAGATFSSVGPTNDGRFKPDLTANSCSATSVYGGCVGNTAYRSSDAATAVASGTAAVVLSAFGAMLPWQLVQYLRNNSPVPGNPFSFTSVLPNNTEGYGAVRLKGTGPRSTPFPTARFSPNTGRLLDTRVASATRNSTAPVPPNGSVSLRINEYGPLSTPRPDRSVVLNVTIVAALGPGYVQVSPGGWSIPGATANLNIASAGQTIGNVVVTPLGPDDSVVIYVRGGGHVVVDYLGEFDPAKSNIGRSLAFAPLDPFRVYDSHCITCGPLTGNTYRDIQVTGVGSATDGWAAVPSTGVHSVLVEVTVDAPATRGFISAVNTFTLPPMPVSTANYPAGGSMSGMSIVDVAESGKIRVFASANTHFQVDVLGYFSLEMEGGGFTPITPARAIDTREPVGAPVPAAGATSVIDVTSTGIPADAGAVIGNFTIAQPDGPGYAKIGRSSVALTRLYRNISIPAAGQAIPSAVVAPTLGGQVRLTATPAAHRILDLSGWFGKISRPNEGELVALPFDSASPPAGGTSPAVSSSGRLLAYNEYASVEALPETTVKLWNRDTGTVEVVDVTTGTELPNASVDPMLVADDGQRILFSSIATNITLDDTNTDLDYFIVDVATSTIRRVNELPDGTRITVTPQFDRAMSRMAFVTDAALLPGDLDLTADVYEMNLDSNKLTLLVDLPAGGTVTFDRDLAAAIIDNSYWRRGQGLIDTIPGAFRISDDGRYVLSHVDHGSTSDIVLYDGDLQTNTPLCTMPDLVQGFAATVDWSAGPPPVGTWCEGGLGSRGWIVNAAGATKVYTTWTGVPPVYPFATYPDVGAFVTAGGLVAFTSTATNLLPGDQPFDWIYIWDHPGT